MLVVQKCPYNDSYLDFLFFAQILSYLVLGKQFHLKIKGISHLLFLFKLIMLYEEKC